MITIKKVNYQSEYIPFTNEQKEKAANTNLAAFLLSQGESLKRCGSEMIWENGGRVTIRDNLWYSQYEQVGGNAIEFVRKFYNVNYQEAVQMLLDERIEPLSVAVKQKDKKPFELPERNNEMRQVFAYLLNSRFIDREVVKHFAHENLLYESKNFHNCVFVGVDNNGIPRHAHKRGTYTMGESYKGNVESCDAEYSFHHNGNSDSLYVFEAPIDMLSFITLYPNNWQEHSYVALCSVADHAMVRMLKDNLQINKVFLCLDNDIAGIESEYRIRNHLKGLGYNDVTFLRPQYKDWNEVLQARNGKQPLPAVPHPTLNKMRDIIKDTIPKVMEEKPMAYPFKTIKSDYIRLTKAVTDEHITASANRLAKDSLRMAKEMLHADEKTLMRGIVDHYLPHTDKTSFDTKLKKMSDDMESVEKLFGNNQTRIASVLQQDVQNLYKLACDSMQIKLHIAIQDEIENFTNEMKGSDQVWETHSA